MSSIFGIKFSNLGKYFSGNIPLKYYCARYIVFSPDILYVGNVLKGEKKVSWIFYQRNIPIILEHIFGYWDTLTILKNNF